MKARYIFLVMVAGLLVSCTKAVKLTVTQEVINPCYLGNGIEWDPYDEAIPWGQPCRTKIGIRFMSGLITCSLSMSAA